MGEELKKQILQRNGILQEEEIKKKPSILNCLRCELVNALENQFCSKCSYPLNPEAYEEIKSLEEKRIEKLELKYENDMKHLKDEMNNQLSQIISMIQQNPKIDDNYLKQFPEFVEFQVGKREKPKYENAKNVIDKTPSEILEESYKIINDELGNQLLGQVKSCNP